jgi:hypothetical protein
MITYLSRYAFRLSAPAFGLSVTALLAACGGSQPPIGAPGAMPQGRATATQAEYGRSWALPKAPGDLLYVTSFQHSGLAIYTYPRGKHLGQVPTYSEPSAECADMAGNIFAIFSAEILEFARGGTTPIRTLPDPSGTPLSCSADPTTGNLAVVNESLPSNPGILLIYKPATGTPVSYSDTDINLYHVGYDNKGNIFVDGLSRVSGKRVGLAELPKGGSSFKNIKLDRLVEDPGSVQWDGKYMTVDDNRVIHRFTVSRSRGKVVGSTKLITHQIFAAVQTWIQGDAVVAVYVDSACPSLCPTAVSIWRYPAGGKPTKSISGLDEPLAVAVSVAPNH